MVYYFCAALWKIFFRITGPLYLIYYVNPTNGELKNVTLYYYTGLCRFFGKFASANYFCKKFSMDRTEYFSFNGHLKDLKKNEPICVKDCSKKIYPKRKNVMLLLDEEPIHFDLNQIDNYAGNMLDSIVDEFHFMEWVTNCFELECTHVQFTTLVPFKKEIYSVEEMVLKDLYHGSY